MKKIIVILLFSLTAYCSQAQTSFRQTAYNTTGAILNTSSDTMAYTLTKSYGTVSVQPIITKATGTMAGKAYLYHSSDGSNWVVSDSLTLSNVTTNTTIWTKNSAAKYWRVIQTGATTVTGTAAAKMSAAE